MDITKGVTVFLLVGVLFTSVVAGSGIGAAQPQQFAVQASNNTTTSETATPAPTAEVCEPGSDEPSLSQSRLYAPEKTLESGEPGQIAGGFQVSNTADCPVRVSITMQVPSGMQIEGSSDVMSGGAGMVTADFTVRPGEIRSIRASVFSENTGSRTVTADVQYWPEGHREMAKQIDGISMSFDVQEPVTPSEENDSSPSPLGGMNTTQIMLGGVGVLLLVAIVGLIAS